MSYKNKIKGRAEKISWAFSYNLSDNKNGSRWTGTRWVEEIVLEFIEGVGK